MMDNCNLTSFITKEIYNKNNEITYFTVQICKISGSSAKFYRGYEKTQTQILIKVQICVSFLVGKLAISLNITENSGFF